MHKGGGSCGVAGVRVRQGKENFAAAVVAVKGGELQGGVPVAVGQLGVAQRAQEGKAALAALRCRVGEGRGQASGGGGWGSAFDGGEHGGKVVGQDGVEYGRRGGKVF